VRPSIRTVAAALVLAGLATAAFADSFTQNFLASSQETVSTGLSAPLNPEGFLPMIASY
jgi:hypothetical protein